MLWFLIPVCYRRSRIATYILHSDPISYTLTWFCLINVRHLTCQAWQSVTPVPSSQGLGFRDSQNFKSSRKGKLDTWIEWHRKARETLTEKSSNVSTNPSRACSSLYFAMPRQAWAWLTRTSLVQARYLWHTYGILLHFTALGQGTFPISMRLPFLVSGVTLPGDMPSYSSLQPSDLSITSTRFYTRYPRNWYLTLSCIFPRKIRLSSACLLRTYSIHSTNPFIHPVLRPTRTLRVLE